LFAEYITEELNRRLHQLGTFKFEAVVSVSASTGWRIGKNSTGTSIFGVSLVAGTTDYGWRRAEFPELWRQRCRRFRKS